MSSRFIDADSQVTALWNELPKEWVISARTAALVDSTAIAIGHSVFAELHHFVALVLRDLSSSVHALVADDISDKCQRSLGGSPDYILFPGYSTISYFLEHLSNIPPDRWIVLTPALRSYGRFQLRLEMSGEQNRRIRSPDPLRILFLDDSRSSGVTEQEALNAFVRTRVPMGRFAKMRTSRPDRWLSYCILRRGVRWASSDFIPRKCPKPRITNLPLPPSIRGQVIKAHSVSFCEVGPEASTTATCPFVEASRLVNAAINWVSNCRPQISDALTRVQEHVMPRQLTHPGPKQPLLTASAARAFLHLCSLDLPRAACRIHDATTLDTAQLHAGLLFAALHFKDIMSYLSHERFFDLFRQTALMATNDSPYDSTILLAASSVLPTSIVAEMTEPVLRALVDAQSPDTASALLALTFLRFDALAHEHGKAPELHSSSAGSRPDDVDIVQRLRSAKVVSVNETLHSLDTPEHRRNDTAALILRDMLAIGSGPESDSIVIVARKLASLLYPGDHGFFLTRQLEAIDSLGYQVAIRTMMRALTLAETFAAFFHYDIHNVTQNAQCDIEALRATMSDTNARKCREIGMQLRSDLWQVVFNTFCCTGKTWASQLERARDNVKLKLPPDERNDELFMLIPPSPEVQRWYALVGDTGTMLEHLDNVLMNPFLHFHGRRAEWSADYLESLVATVLSRNFRPLVVTFFVMNERTQRLQLVVASAGAKPDASRLFAAIHGLGGVRLGLQEIGGRVRYEWRQSGLADLEGLDLGNPSPCLGVQSPDAYTNLFITELPTLWENTYGHASDSPVE